jgi:hypothetical protein
MPPGTSALAPRARHSHSVPIACVALFACAAVGPVRAVQYPGFIPMVTDSVAVFPTPPLYPPLHLLAVQEPTFGTAVMRISGDPGTDVGGLGPYWGEVVRHNYSKQAAWNSSMHLLSLDNSGTGLSPVILNGQTYQPRFAPCGGYDNYDWRWHPTTAHRNEQINVNRDGTELMWYDVSTCTKTRSWPLPIVAEYGIGSSKGNTSNDGRYVAIANDSQIVVVDMDPQPPHAPYPNLRIGPVFTIPACSLDVTAPDTSVVSWVSISPSGKYLDVKFKSVPRAGQTSCDTLCEMHRVFKVNDDLTLEIQNMEDASMRCGSFAARPNGWIFPLKHSDMALDPFDDNEDVIMGGRACPGSSIGRVVKVRMRDGLVTPLTDPVNEPSYYHGSARNLQRPGWFYVTYSGDPVFANRKFQGEVIAVKMDGSSEVQRFAHHRSSQDYYQAEAHAVPSPDGKRVLIASNWCVGTPEPCPDPDRVQAYVIDARLNALVDVPEPEPGTRVAPREIQLSPPRPNPSRDGFLVRFALPSSRPTALEVHDVTGRRVAVHNVGVLGPGEHTLELDPMRRLPTGVYLVTLTDGRHLRSTKAVVVR